MVPDWRTNQVFFSRLLPDRHPMLWLELQAILRQHNIVLHLVPDTKDVWVRDFLPVQVSERRFVKFVYRPDYLQGYPHLTTSNEVLAHLEGIGGIRKTDLVVDGGNVVGCENRVILTDKVLRENPSQNEGEVVSTMRRLLEAEEVVVIPTDSHDDIGHADGVVRFLDDRTVAINDYSVVNPSYGRKVRSVLRRYNLQIEELPHFFENHEQDGINSAVGNYVNYLRVESLVIVPSYGRSEDGEAVGRLQELLPGTTVVSVPCFELAREGGVLNCVSWTMQL